MNVPLSFFGPAADTQERLALVVDTMRELSRQTDPQAIVRLYNRRMQELIPTDRRISLSRRELMPPRVRVTRFNLWTEEINPWKERERLPVLTGGLLADLIWAGEPRVIDDLRLAAGDPSAAYLADQRSLMALPMFDQGESLNMVVMAREEPGAFAPERLPEHVWLANLFGRMTGGLVLKEQAQSAYAAVDYEMKLVAEIQRSLLPRRLPPVPTLDLAAHYQTAHRAGGDYYDFFPLPQGKWGVLIADVSGHGTPAAVRMAITHSIAHAHPGPPAPPSAMLAHVNRVLAQRYTTEADAFVTAFYGIYDPTNRLLTYSSAGHNPPRLKRCEDGTIASLNRARALPLGIDEDAAYVDAQHQLQPGDQIIFYTDGIIEASNGRGELFGMERLDLVLHDCMLSASGLIRAVLDAVEAFADGAAQTDDRTLVVAKVS